MQQRLARMFPRPTRVCFTNDQSRILNGKDLPQPLPKGQKQKSSQRKKPVHGGNNGHPQHSSTDATTPETMPSDAHQKKPVKGKENGKEKGNGKDNGKDNGKGKGKDKGKGKAIANASACPSGGQPTHGKAKTPPSARVLSASKDLQPVAVATMTSSSNLMTGLSSKIADMREIISTLSSEQLGEVRDILNQGIDTVEEAMEEERRKEWELGDDLIRLDSPRRYH